jgi:tetratricopeptide (TPR) repeat protein
MPKMNTSFNLLKIILFIIFLSTFGCMSWKAGWKQFKQPSIKGDISSLLDKANQQISEANTKEKVLELIRTYETVLKIDPENREALSGLGSYCLLMGYGYAENDEEKEKYLLRAIKYNEQLMYTNPDFKELVDKGEDVWEACRVLSKDEMGAMLGWFSASGIYWKECFSGFGRLINIQWPFRGKKILNRMMEIDPTWGGGTPYYLWANFYAVAPGFFGGDMEKAEEYYKKAVELGPEMLNFRRTRALFFHTQNNDRDSFEKDLNWVISQNPRKVRHYLTYPWNVFIQRNAKDLLEHADEYFD